ncbi:hypothetical protein M514_28384 [Trichuris suis]|uniref:Uncharacterized protein n=1 Tax=Trichuris suis TaxID=68888 RepID=A0A085MD15_9BILA|nr:hypothetical protein M513_14029 [Trichuris suis]KFD55111.1 hypothetical protein M513_04029 [Trichuris suis]KFD59437.1 hypothetical protein M514_28384 [Trichuris suis]
MTTRKRTLVVDSLLGEDNISTKGASSRYSPGYAELNEVNAMTNRHFQQQLKNVDWDEVADRKMKMYSPRKEGPPLHVAYKAMQEEMGTMNTSATPSVNSKQEKIVVAPRTC